ncbi:MAG: metallophosphoesterase [Candidatus Thorarchaeota archaeon SMTZ1-45]
MSRQKITTVLVIAIVLSSTAVVGLSYLQIAVREDDDLNFYVFGDSQGYQGGIEQIAGLANQYRPDFVIHCGDLTPFGQEEQYSAVSKALNAIEVPVHITPGNHDIRLGGGSRYVAYFGHARYSYDFGQAHFTFFNTSANDVTEEEFRWLKNDLSQAQAEWKFVFTHIPPFDPRVGHEHSLMNETTSSRLMALFSEYDVNTVFTGHIHMYNVSIRNAVRYVITGGAGASLYANASNGGIHHFVNVTLSNSNLILEMVPLQSPDLPRDAVIVRSTDEDVTLSVRDLQVMAVVDGFSSFQNRYGNWRCYGEYRGVRVSDLVDLVGGMDSDEIVRVTSYDGFAQDFHWSNVYPNASWYSIQGHMILAFEYNGTAVPDWSDGIRLVMLPPDEGYSNEDCLYTSSAGTGCHVYESAGARWVRFVSYVEVIQG